MKEAIKIGDLFIVYDKSEIKPTGFWYEIGYELSQYYQQFLIWLKKHKTSTNRNVVQRLIRIKTTDYSIYDTPTIYRKWR
jgi:hypothetical protein